jgi:glycosyltransferase involved in cell wall biosynthesis
MSRWTDVLVTINDEDYRAAQKMKLKKGGKLFMIHGAGVEVGQSREGDRAAKRAEIGLPEDAVAIVSAGILNKNKNNRVIIEALGKLENKNVYYVVCGEGDEESALRELAISLGVSDRVLFLGFRTDMKQIMLACDIFAMPSFREGVPRALLEAMDLGLPCIGTRTRGIRELIGNDKLLCGGSSAEEFSAAIDYVINNPEDCKKIIARNVEEAKLYSKERVRAEYAAIYEEVLK